MRKICQKYGVVVPNGAGAGIANLVEKPDAMDEPSKLASIGPYVLGLIFLTLCEGSRRDQAGKFNWQMQIISMRSWARSILCALMVDGLIVIGR